jgi:vacuolar-type H+-ATPase subunit E/Vma4
MALEDIFKALDQQADDECEQILQEARDHAEVIAADAEAQAESIRTAHVAEVEKVTRARASQTANAARLEARKRVAAVKQQAVEHAFDRAAEKLGAVRASDRYASVFTALSKETLAGVEGDFTIEVDPADADLARSVLVATGERGSIAADLSTNGGLVVGMSGGRIVRRNTLEDRLEKVRELDQAAVAERIFS